MITIQIWWSFVKKYWFLFVGVGSAIIGYLLLRKNNVDINKIIDGINSDHAADLQSIKKKEEAISAAKNEADSQMKRQLEESNKKFDDLENKLAKEQSARTEKILEETGSDPDALATELAKQIGSKKLN